MNKKEILRVGGMVVKRTTLRGNKIAIGEYFVPSYNLTPITISSRTYDSLTPFFTNGKKFENGVEVDYDTVGTLKEGVTFETQHIINPTTK